MQKEAIPCPPLCPAQMYNGVVLYDFTEDDVLGDITGVEGSLQSKCANYCTKFLPTQSLLIRDVTGGDFQLKICFRVLHLNALVNSTNY